MKPLLVAVMLIVGSDFQAAASEVANVATNTATKFYCVVGEGVVAPGRFAYEDGITLAKAIKLAGGCTRWALKNKVQLIRPGELSARDVLSQIEMGKTNDLRIRPGDYVLVEQARTVYRVERR